MNRFYHINRNRDCNWRVGDEFHFGNEHNLMWRSYFEKGPSIKLNGEKHSAERVIKTALDFYLRGGPVPIQMRGYHFNPVFTLKEATDCLGQSTRIIRELIFEVVRREFYPNLPSRQYCIWLAPNDILSLEFWKKSVYGNHKRIFRVETEGINHRAAQKWLATDTIPLNEIELMSHNYWKGNDIGSNEDEILFIGKLKVIEELSYP